MIENLQSLWTDPGYPSLHVVVIHFPIALLALAPFFDIGCLVFRSRVWLDRTAAALYVIGTIGAGAAYLGGHRRCAARDLARLGVFWLARHDRRVTIGIFRLAAIPIAIAGLLVLALTADRGGRLVYQHGVGVSPQDVGTLKR